MFDEARAGIIDPGVQEVYCDGSEQVVEEDMVHSTLWVQRGGDKVAVMIVHMSRKKHATNVRRIFQSICSGCTLRALQSVLLPIALALMGG